MSILVLVSMRDDIPLPATLEYEIAEKRAVMASQPWQTGWG